VRSMYLAGLLSLLVACSREPSSVDQSGTSLPDPPEVSATNITDPSLSPKPTAVDSVNTASALTEEVPEELAFTDVANEETDAVAADLVENAVDAASLQNVRLASSATTNLFAAAAQQHYAMRGSSRSRTTETPTVTEHTAAEASAGP
jgi:hypothetical protein